jgi:hypothetical protein
MEQLLNNKLESNETIKFVKCTKCENPTIECTWSCDNCPTRYCSLDCFRGSMGSRLCFTLVSPNSHNKWYVASTCPKCDMNQYMPASAVEKWIPQKTKDMFTRWQPLTQQTESALDLETQINVLNEEIENIVAEDIKNKAAGAYPTVSDLHKEKHDLRFDLTRRYSKLRFFGVVA